MGADNGGGLLPSSGNRCGSDDHRGTRHLDASRLRLVEGQEAEGKARIKALRDAARAGIADIEAGLYRTFNAPADLEHHLGTLQDNALSPKSRSESDG